MKIIHALIVISVLSAVDAYAIDPMLKIQEMLNDLGGDPSQVTHNNGKTFSCAFVGTKKVTIKLGEKKSTYSAVYDNCRDANGVRDSIYEIETVDNEVVLDEEKPTKNKELFNAATFNDIAKIRLQLKNKANVNVPYKMSMVGGGEVSGWTSLAAAALNGNLEIVKLLLKEGAWINYLNSDLRNSLWHAVSTGNVPVVKYLLKNGAYVNNSDIEDTTPLMKAASDGDIEIVKLLLAYKSNVNLKHKDGDTALMFAIANGQSEIARLLIAAEADLNVNNKQGITALIICAAENNMEIAKLLLSKKANPNAKTDFGKTALDIAAVKGFTQMVQLLSGIK